MFRGGVRACASAHTARPTTLSSAAVAQPPRIYLARHGQTAYNAEGRFQGQGAVPLDDDRPRPGAPRSPSRPLPTSSSRCGAARCCAPAKRRTSSPRRIGLDTARGLPPDGDRRRRLDRPLLRRRPGRGPRGVRALRAAATPPSPSPAASPSRSRACAWRPPSTTSSAPRRPRWSSATAASSASRSSSAPKTAASLGNPVPNAAIVALDPRGTAPPASRRRARRRHQLSYCARRRRNSSRTDCGRPHICVTSARPARTSRTASSPSMPASSSRPSVQCTAGAAAAWPKRWATSRRQCQSCWE